MDVFCHENLSDRSIIAGSTPRTPNGYLQGKGKKGVRRLTDKVWSQTELVGGLIRKVAYVAGSRIDKEFMSLHALVSFSSVIRARAELTKSLRSISLIPPRA